MKQGAAIFIIYDEVSGDVKAILTASNASQKIKSGELEFRDSTAGVVLTHADVQKIMDITSTK